MSMQFSARKTVIPNPRGGYDAYSMPDPNQGLSGDMYSAVVTPSLAETSSRAKEYHRNYDAAEKEQLRAMPLRQKGVFGSSTVSSAPRSRAMDAFFQVLQEHGVDKLSAEPMTPGGSPSFFGDQFAHGDDSPGAGTASAPPGYTQSRAIQELKNYQAGGAAPGFAQTPGGAPAQMTPGNRKYVANILNGLQRAQGRSRIPNVVADARNNYEAGNAVDRFEEERNARAAYLDQQDAARGRTNVRRR